MEMYMQNSCEKLYWETARQAVAECQLMAIGALRLCRSIFRFEEEKELENRYGHLFTPYGEGDVGGKILDRMVALSIPAYGDNLNAIEEMLDDPYHSELNAHYYMQTGRVLAEDYTFPAFDWDAYRELRDLDGAKAIAMWEAYEEKKRELFLSIAETLWDFEWFAEKYQGLVSEEEIAAYHDYCRKIFLEERIFLQPEWLLFSAKEWWEKADFLRNNPCTDFFLQAHKDSLGVLPDCALKSKELKETLAKKYKIKRF